MMGEKIVSRRIEDYLQKEDVIKLREKIIEKRILRSDGSLGWYPPTEGYTSAVEDGAYLYCNECGMIDDENHMDEHIVDVGEIEMIMGCVPAMDSGMVMHDSDFTEISVEDTEEILSPDF